MLEGEGCKYTLSQAVTYYAKNPARDFSLMILFYGVFLDNGESLYQVITFWCRAINNVQSYLQDKKCVYLLAFRKYFVWYCSHSNSKTNSSSCQKKSVIVHLGLDLMSKRERFNFYLFVWSSKGKTVVKILQLAIKLSAFMGYEKRVAGFSPHLFNFWWQSLKPLLHLFYKITPIFMCPLYWGDIFQLLRSVFESSYYTVTCYNFIVDLCVQISTYCNMQLIYQPNITFTFIMNGILGR